MASDRASPPGSGPSGAGPSRSGKVTLATIASQLGVSAVTVSNVVNNRGGVSEATRERVLAAVEAAGYVANPAARSLAGGRTNTIGVLVHDLATQYANEIIRGASEELRELGMEMLVSTAADPDQERQRVRFLGQLTDGLLFLLPRFGHRDRHSLPADDVPMVLLEHQRGDEGPPTVNIDDYGGVREAVDHLIRLDHERIGYLSGMPGWEARERAYRDALEAAGLPFDPHLVAPGDFDQRRGFAATGELLRLPDPPSAIMAANDVSAFGAMEAIKHHGLAIPGDVSVVGFDDVPMASQVFPPLTTVHRPLADMGGVAVRTLLALLRGEEVADEVVLPTRLTVRSTTGRRGG